MSCLQISIKEKKYFKYFPSQNGACCSKSDRTFIPLQVTWWLLIYLSSNQNLSHLHVSHQLPLLPGTGSTEQHTSLDPVCCVSARTAISKFVTPLRVASGILSAVPSLVSARFSPCWGYPVLLQTWETQIAGGRRRNHIDCDFLWLVRSVLAAVYTHKVGVG